MDTQKVDFDVLAHDKASDKLGRIARAFRKLKSDSDNIDGDGLTDLSKKLRTLAGDFDKEGNRAGKGFGSGLKKWFTGDGQGLFNEVGKSGGTFFGSGLLGALKTPILGPALVAAVGAAAATVMPAVGAIAGGALVTGFGAGIAGLGLVFAAQSDAVGKKWSTTLSQLGSDMRLLSKPFESTLISIAGIFERTVDRFNPALGKAFAKMAPVVTNFVDQTGRAFEQLIPAIGPITDAFDGVLDALGPAMQSALGDISAGMIELANSVAENPQALADLVAGLGSLTKTALGLITTLNDVNSGFSELTGGVSLVDVTFGGLKFAIGAVAAPFQALSGAIAGVNALIGRTGKDVEGAGQSMSDAASNTVKLAQGLGSTATASKSTSMALQSVTDALPRQKAQFSAAIEAMSQWNTKALAGSNAAIAYEAAIDDATASVKENGRTLDINTAKGRANRTALNSVAEAANQQTKAMDDAGASNVTVARKAESARAKFVTLARQMGLSATEAGKLATKLINIPNVTRTAKLQADKKDLENKLAEAKRKLADPKLTATKKAKLSADIAALQRAVNAAQSKINSLTGKTVTIRTRHIEERIVRGQSGATGGHLPGFAHGGRVSAGRPIIVGENRPEVFVPDTNGTILPRVPQSAAGAAAAGGGPRIVLEVRPGNFGPFEQMFLTWLKNAVRVKGGGSVQAALGSGRG